jgi:hypothetical protein
MLKMTQLGFKVRPTVQNFINIRLNTYLENIFIKCHTTIATKKFYKNFHFISQIFNMGAISLP